MAATVIMMTITITVSFSENGWEERKKGKTKGIFSNLANKKFMRGKNFFLLKLFCNFAP